MKHLLTLTALLISSLAMGQMPYNPDSNGDDMVGATDLLDFLFFYGSTLIQSELTCDYEGTTFETFFAGIINQELIVDSVYFEYYISDSVETFVAGCPDPVMLEVVLNRSFTLTDDIEFLDYSGFDEVRVQGYYLGKIRQLRFIYFSNGTYDIRFTDDEIPEFFPYLSEHAGMQNPLGGSISLPFPESFELTEDGISAFWNSWIGETQNFRLIPFWSEAE